MSQHFSRVGQHPHSMDCGFFSGYVLGLYEGVGYPGLANMMMSANDVYQARSDYFMRFYNGNPPPDKMHPGPHGRLISNGLEVSEVKNFLNGLNSPGYRVDAGPHKNVQEIRTMLHKHLASPPNFACIMVCIDSLISAHWITILYRSDTPQNSSNTPASGGTPANGALPTLKWGAKSEAVKTLQIVLNAAGRSIQPRLAEDGIFGQNTYNRVREYQQSQPGLAVDGIVGPNTWGKLKPGHKTSAEPVSASASFSSASGSSSPFYYGIYNPGLLGANFYASEMTEEDLIADLAKGGVNYVAWRYRT